MTQMSSKNGEIIESDFNDPLELCFVYDRAKGFYICQMMQFNQYLLVLIYAMPLKNDKRAQHRSRNVNATGIYGFNWIFYIQVKMASNTNF